MAENTSRALQFSSLSKEERLEVLSHFTPEEQDKILHTWEFWARPNQMIPSNCLCHRGDWVHWLILAGRGYGKTRTGAETVRRWAEEASTEYITLAAAKALDIRDVMVEGESGILAVSPNSFRPKYEPSKRRLTWPNGVKGLLLSADEPDTFRGPQHGKAWADELAKWPYPEAWSQLKFGLRLGKKPQTILTTTPRPTDLIKQLIKDPTCHVTRGTTYENRANLSKVFFEQVVKMYEGTRLGRQELNAEVLSDNPGALWKRDMIEATRVARAPALKRIAIGVDPAVTSKETSDETGIVAFGTGWCTCKGLDKKELHGFVMRDVSGIYTPNEWATQVSKIYRSVLANVVVAEINKGGDLVVANIRTVDPSIKVEVVRASRGKDIRAEPIAALYEQGKIHHVGVNLETLEDQMCDWNPLTSADSPDRLDALVWAASHLMLTEFRPVYESFGSGTSPISPRRGSFH